MYECRCFMVTFKFREIGEALGTRQLGAQARERLFRS